MGFDSDSDNIDVLCRETATVYLCGDIDDVLASRIVQSFNRLRGDGKEEITLLISSDGGSVFGSYAIADAVREAREAGVKVTGVVRGRAMSGAVFPLLECSPRLATSMSVVMVHGMQGKTSGDQKSVRAESVLNEKMIDQQALYYAGKTSRNDPDYWRPLLETGTPKYYMAHEALVEGLVDVVLI